MLLVELIKAHSFTIQHVTILQMSQKKRQNFDFFFTYTFSWCLKLFNKESCLLNWFVC